MPTKRKAMRQIKEVLRLKFEAKLSHERIAAATGLSKGAVTHEGVEKFSNHENPLKTFLLDDLGRPYA